jgi:hypothetical protein
MRSVGGYESKASAPKKPFRQGVSQLSDLVRAHVILLRHLLPFDGSHWPPSPWKAGLPT